MCLPKLMFALYLRLLTFLLPATSQGHSWSDKNPVLSLLLLVLLFARGARTPRICICKSKIINKTQAERGRWNEETRVHTQKERGKGDFFVLPAISFWVIENSSFFPSPPPPQEQKYAYFFNSLSGVRNQGCHIISQTPPHTWERKR